MAREMFPAEQGKSIRAAIYHSATIVLSMPSKIWQDDGGRIIGESVFDDRIEHKSSALRLRVPFKGLSAFADRG